MIVGDEDMKSIYDKIAENSSEIIGLYDVESHKRETYNAKMREIEKEATERGLEKGMKQGIHKNRVSG